MSWKRAEAEMFYCEASLKGTGKLSGCICVEWLCGLFGYYFAFLLHLEKKWRQDMKISGFMFLFSLSCSSSSEGFDYDEICILIRVFVCFGHFLW